MIKNITMIATIYSLAASLLSYFYINASFSVSVLFGGLVVLLNMAALSFSWNLIFSKKSIALAVFVIIFKYLILAVILWVLSSTKWLNIIGFLIGLISLVFSILVAMMIKSLARRGL